LQNGRPMPILRLKTVNRSFQEHWYVKKDWLCGSEALQKLFCWPCILFSPGTSRSWTLNGYANMQGFLSDCKKHERSQCHVSAVEKYNSRIIEIIELRFSRANSEEEQNSDQDGWLAKVIEDLKIDLKEAREQLLKSQEKVHELEEENEVLSSLLTHNRAFQQQQQEIFDKRIKFKDEVIRRLKRDIEELTNSEVESEKNTETTMNEDFSDNIENSLNQNEKAFEQHREEIKVDDFVLYHTCNGKFYMGKAIDVSHQSGLLHVQYGESKDGINHDFSDWKTTFVSKESVFRWGNLDDVGASCIGDNLYRLTIEQVNLVQ